jgi:ABC-type transport system substrate-binding protein
MKKRFPQISQWVYFFKVLNKKERLAFLFFLILFVGSGIYLINFYYSKYTKIFPAKGGKYVEGIVGKPMYINPLFSFFSETDADLVELTFSGLLRYGENGKLEKDLVKDYQILEDGKVFEFELKENLFWQDGKPITADDVVFTIESIKNPAVKSPLRVSWIGVDVEKISETKFRFKLKEPSSVFLENCTVKIIPKHVWEKIEPENFMFSSFNLNPIGSGPYKVAGVFLNKEGNIVNLDLIENSYYYGKKPYIPKISFRFFKNEDELISAFNSGLIDGFSISNPKILQKISLPFNLYTFKSPKYFAIFLNQKVSTIFEEKKVREALNYATNREELVKEVLLNQGEIVFSPFTLDPYNIKEPQKEMNFDLSKAASLLEEAGFLLKEGGKRIKIVKKEPPFQLKSDLSIGARGKEVEELQKCLAKDPEIWPEGEEITGYFGKKTKEAIMKFQQKYKEELLLPFGLKEPTGKVDGETKKKLNEICFPPEEEKTPLSFVLLTGDDEILKKTAEILKKQWEKVGFDVEIKTVDLATLKRESFRKKDYEALLFGISLRFIPDPFAFWHSSQRGELGLNLANYSNKETDTILEEIRKSLDENQRKEKLEKFQEILLEDLPTIFLFSENEIFVTSKKIKGIKDNIWILDSSKRFNQIENWFTKTKREF